MLLQDKIWSPTVQITTLPVQNGAITVVRDDLLEGGTKQRGVVPFLETYQSEGIEEFVYASPLYGFAQVALATGCKQVGAKCAIFNVHMPQDCLEHKIAERYIARIAALKNIGCIRTYPSLQEADDAAVAYANSGSRLKVPLGICHPVFMTFLQKELLTQWEYLRDLLGHTPKQIWVPFGSGTLAFVLRKIIPPQVRLICVNVRVLPENDVRIERVRKLANTDFLTVPEPFSEVASLIPPVPSNIFYDAKLWQFIVQRALSGDVWWNVAS